MSCRLVKPRSHLSETFHQAARLYYAALPGVPAPNKRRIEMAGMQAGGEGTGDMAAGRQGTGFRVAR